MRARRVAERRCVIPLRAFDGGVCKRRPGGGDACAESSHVLDESTARKGLCRWRATADRRVCGRVNAERRPHFSVPSVLAGGNARRMAQSSTVRPASSSTRRLSPARQIGHALLVLLALSRAAAASPDRVHLELRDVNGQPVVVGAPEHQRTTVLFFMSRTSREASTAFARAVDELLLGRAVDSVAIVDVRRYAGLLTRGFALRAMQKSVTEARERRRQRRLASRVDPSSSVEGWHLVADFDGALFTHFGIAQEPAGPLAFLVDRAGRLYGPYVDAAAVAEAVTRQLR